MTAAPTAAAVVTHSDNNFQRWFAHGVESNAWSLVMIASTPAAACIIGVWAALTAFESSLSHSDVAVDEGSARDVLDVRFAPFPISDIQQLYLVFSTAVFARVGFVAPLACVYLVGFQLPNQRVARVVDALVALLFVLTLVTIGALVASYYSAAPQIDAMHARTANVTQQFDAFYCTARIGSLCTDPSVSVAALQRVFTDSSGDINAMERVVRGCRHVFVQLESTKGAASHSIGRRTAFLATCTTSNAMDRWCSDFVLTSASGTVATSADDGDVQTQAPSLVRRMRFREFAVAWTTRFEFDAIMLSVAGCALLLLCIAWTRMLTSDKRLLSSVSSATKAKRE